MAAITHRKITTWGGNNHQITANSTAVSNSTPKYRKAIGARHSAHFPRNHSQLIIGRFSHIGIGLRHFGQNERFGSLTDMPSGTR